MKKRTFLAALAAAPLAPMLSACGGGGGDSGSAKVRFVNASVGYDSLDFYLNNDRKAAAVAYGVASSYSKVDSDDFTIAVRQADGSTTLDSSDRSFSKDTSYSVIAFGDRGSLDTALIAENEDDPDDGYAKLRIYNRTATPVGVYIADAGTDDVTDAVAVVASVSASNASGFVSEGEGTYTLFVTTVADQASDREVLLKIDSITLSDQQIATLVVIPSAGAVLVNAILLNQDDDATPYTTAEARVRLVAGTTGKKVTAKVGSTTLSSGTTGPSVGVYKTVPYGTSAVVITVDDQSVSAANLVAERGGDYTLVVYGDDDIKVKVLTDDNELPTDEAKTSFRFVHLAPAYAEQPLSLFLNTSKQLALDIDYGNASDYLDDTAVTSSDGSNKLEVKTGQSGTAIWSVTDTAIDPQAVYTVFVFGENSAYLATDRDSSS